MENTELFKLAASTWGEEAQIRVAIEECGEFLSAIMKSYRGRATNEQIVDEIADVTIMMQQMAVMFGQEAVDERIKYKIDRIKQRLEKHNDKI